MTPHELARRLRDQMSDLELLLAADDVHASARPVANAWSLKEILSHLIGAPGDSFLHGIRRILVEDDVMLEYERGLTHFTADRRARSVDELVEAVAGQYVAIADLIETVGEDSLERRALAEMAVGSPYGERPTLFEYASLLSEHVAEHLAAIGDRIG
jgi:hypothetical protein